MIPPGGSGRSGGAVLAGPGADAAGDGGSAPRWGTGAGSARGSHVLCLVYIVFFLQGVGMLFPWNVFITAAQYFHVRLKGTAFQDNFENVFSFSYSFSNLIFMTVAVRWAHLPLFNMRSTVVVPQIVTAVIFAATTALVLDDAIPGSMLFVVTACFVLVTGVTAALIQAGIFGLAGRFPSVYTQAVMSGQGVAGMTVSIISLITALSTPCSGSSAAPSWHQIQPASFNYFLSSTIVILLTLIAFVLLTRSDFAQFYAFASPETIDAVSSADSPSGSYRAYDDDYCDPTDGKSLGEIAEALDQAMLTPRTRRRIIEKRRSIMAAPVFQAKSPPSSTHSSRRSTPGTQTPRSRSLPKGLTSTASVMSQGSRLIQGHRRSRTGASQRSTGSSGGSSSYSSGMNSPSGTVSPGGDGQPLVVQQQPVVLGSAAVAVRSGVSGVGTALMRDGAGGAAKLDTSLLASRQSNSSGDGIILLALTFEKGGGGHEYSLMQVLMKLRRPEFDFEEDSIRAILCR